MAVAAFGSCSGSKIPAGSALPSPAAGAAAAAAAAADVDDAGVVNAAADVVVALRVTLV